MFRFDEDLTVYLQREAIDFRVGLNGLAILVEQALGLDPFAKAVYVFRNRRRDRVKILSSRVRHQTTQVIDSYRASLSDCQLQQVHVSVLGWVFQV